MVPLCITEGDRELSGPLFLKALIPFLRPPPSGPYHLPEAQPSTNHIGDFNVWIWENTINQTTGGTSKSYWAEEEVSQRRCHWVLKNKQPDEGKVIPLEGTLCNKGTEAWDSAPGSGMAKAGSSHSPPRPVPLRGREGSQWSYLVWLVFLKPVLVLNCHPFERA